VVAGFVLAEVHELYGLSDAASHEFTAAPGDDPREVQRAPVGGTGRGGDGAAPTGGLEWRGDGCRHRARLAAGREGRERSRVRAAPWERARSAVRPWTRGRCG